MIEPRFALKGAMIDAAQLANRAEALSLRGYPIRLELHSVGERDIDTREGQRAVRDNLTRLRDHYPVESLIVHVPYQAVATVTKSRFDSGQCERSIDFAHEVGAEAVVLHRYSDLVFADAPTRSPGKPASIAFFQEEVAKLAAMADGMLLLVENIGHFSLLPRDGQHYLTGPLDHFFPWEIADFRAFLKREGIARVEPFVDVAHATLSANLFNRRKAKPNETVGDPRFVWVTDADLERADWLDPFDFVDPTMPYLHVSDAVQLNAGACAALSLPEERLVAAMTSEGLELGHGNLPFAQLPARLGWSGCMVKEARPCTMVLEVEPGVGESHVDNQAQRRSLEKLAALFR
jgi:hypothetical protein